MTWELAEKVLPHVSRLLLIGPPATGKTHLSQHFGLDGRQMYAVTLTPEMSAADLIGCYTISRGDMQWSDGPAVLAWRQGARLNINEIDRGSPETESILYALLDDPQVACLTLPTGETIRPHSRFQAVCTSNVEAVGALPEALRSRLAVTMRLSSIHPKALETLDSDLRIIAARTNAASPEERVSFRHWQAFQHLRRHVGAEDAASAVFGDRAKDLLAAIAMGTGRVR